MASNKAPMTINAVTLQVKDRKKLAGFYQKVIGLDLLFENGAEATLGVNGKPILHLREDCLAKRRPTESGLFHTAFLLPTREHLGAWLRYAADSGVQLDGMADHSVSEAVYLNDPEGNGIEVYVDRSRADWVQDGNRLKIESTALDLKGLLELSDTQWVGAPPETVIGHVHLQVGNIQETNDFYCNTLGFDLMSEMQQASFYGSGGYHHHIAGNTWNSRNAGRRSEEATGLVQLDLQSADHAMQGVSLTDPWGIAVNVAA